MIKYSASFSPKRSFSEGKFTRQLSKPLRRGEEIFVYLNGLLQSRGNDYTLRGQTLRMLWTMDRHDRIDVAFFD